MENGANHCNIGGYSSTVNMSSDRGVDGKYGLAASREGGEAPFMARRYAEDMG